MYFTVIYYRQMMKYFYVSYAIRTAIIIYFLFFLELPNNYLLISIEPSGEVCQNDCIHLMLHLFLYLFIVSTFFFSSFLLVICKDNYFSSICTSFSIWRRCCCCCYYYYYSHRIEYNSRGNKKEKKNILLKDVFYWKLK